MDRVSRNGFMTFGIYGKVDTKVPKSTGYQGIFTRNSAHNPEVVGSSPASATIKEPGIDTKSVPGLFFFIQTFTPKRGAFSNFATHFDFRCPPLVLLPTPRIAEPLHIALLIR